MAAGIGLSGRRMTADAIMVGSEPHIHPTPQDAPVSDGKAHSWASTNA